ncbi:glycerophosphodiester phosphodiesterase [Branchiibius cervicis]|uniref:Glycerophosphodiester phosphodiesterase n=1 Tax=Branchiibius cervicis TaxID=908252 RepID=A0ABW2ARV6_9MICO
MTGFLDWPAPIPMAHRGFSPERWENSRAAFANAVDLGYRYVETDVHATADGVLVAFHDDTLDRVSDGSGAINALPWSAVRQARIGGTEPIPTLAELFETWPDLRVNIDCKAGTAIEPLAAAIERHRAHDRVCVAAFSDRRRRAVLSRLSRRVVTSAGQAVIAGSKLLRWTPLRHRPFGGVDILQIPEWHGRLRILTPALLTRAHAAGVKVHVWTVNDEATMHRLLDEGVDGILTDRADLLKQVLTERGEWVS